MIFPLIGPTTKGFKFVIVTRKTGEVVSGIKVVDLNRRSFVRSVDNIDGSSSDVTESLTDCTISGLEKILTLREWSAFVNS